LPGDPVVSRTDHGNATTLINDPSEEIISETRSACIERRKPSIRERRPSTARIVALPIQARATLGGFAG
jgi:hypothetical protein